MMPLPGYLKRFRRKAEESFLAGDVRDIEFSGPTYQILVAENQPENGCWVFLQLDSRGGLKDAFCSCEESENARGCLHQAVAFRAVYANHILPLHERFERSLWNHLGIYMVETCGTKPQLIEKSPGHFACFSDEGEELFVAHIEQKNLQETFRTLFFDREKPTEETSLKFSNLSDEELDLWQKGRPSAKLAYELSVWSDLAKWLVNLQESDKKYEISFEYAKNRLPQKVIANFPHFRCEWRLDREGLTTIIPALATVETPLKVHNPWKEKIDKITYDQDAKKFVVWEKRQSELANGWNQRQGATQVGEWQFVPKDGFYPLGRSFSLNLDELEDVETLLNTHTKDLQEMIEGVVIRDKPLPEAFSIHFDEEWNLHIEAHLFNKGDLSTAQHFGAWVYVWNNGFYRIVRTEFDEGRIVPEKDVADFVTEYRMWLNTQEGFTTHVSSLETGLSYHLSEQNVLSFTRAVDAQNHQSENKDFGRWIYVQGQGFFSKASMETSLPLHSGVTLHYHQISPFIRRNFDELKMVKGFFSDHNPVMKTGLKIECDESDEVNVMPQYQYFPEYHDRQVRIFDDFSYVAGEGFHEIPAAMRLPDPYKDDVHIQGEAITKFVSEDLPRIAPFIISLDPRMRKPKKQSLQLSSFQHLEEAGKSEYALNMGYQSEYGLLSISSLWNALQKDQRFLFSEAGLIDLSEKKYDWLRSVRKTRVNKKDNTLTLSTLEVLKLNAQEEIILGIEESLSRNAFKNLIDFHEPSEPNLKGLKSTLRPYQDKGVQWLWFLYHHGLSGLLCDDMGLGKTHQAMALIMAVVNYWKTHNETNEKRHFLVVCPTSVLYHWQEKLETFLPELSVWTFHGSNRSLETFYENNDILLTSYGVLRNEIKELSSMKFEVAIFDELQIAKNQNSRIYSALLKTSAKMRLGLTGTPIENRLRELKSLFDLLLPSYMPKEADYREYFIRPIEKEFNLERKQLLARLIHPFILRRKKEDVLLDLPEKIEEIAHCSLLPEQYSTYIDVLTASQNNILEQLQDESMPIPYMHIFSLLARLKQVCNHPASYFKKTAEYKNYRSGKWDLFVELLNEARESGQKVVVFSQYLHMLDIIELYLTEHNIGYAAIRGATRARKEELQRFNHDPKCEVFVGSLQAAGLGVDLTAGSVVIHYDRWWNAARENQATDRVHRIGQTRGVQVFKLVTKNTLEEHIDVMISKKGRLLEDVVNVDNHQVMKKFDRDEMIGLLQKLSTITPESG